MKIILTDDVVGVGDIGETVSVRAGFARNFLIPRGVAIESETASAKEIAHRMLQIEAKKRKLRKEAEQRAQQVAGIVLECAIRVGSGGKVFGSVGTRQIAEKLQEQGIEVDRRRVLLVEPIKKLGSRKVKVKLHADVVVEIDVNVVPMAATDAEEQVETDSARQAMEDAAEQRRAEEDSEDDDSESEDDSE